MALRQIRLYDDPILRKKSKEVEVVDDKIRDILYIVSAISFNISLMLSSTTSTS